MRACGWVLPRVCRSACKLLLYGDHVGRRASLSCLTASIWADGSAWQDGAGIKKKKSQRSCCDGIPPVDMFTSLLSSHYYITALSTKYLYLDLDWLIVNYHNLKGMWAMLCFLPRFLTSPCLAGFLTLLRWRRFTDGRIKKNLPKYYETASVLPPLKAVDSRNAFCSRCHARRLEGENNTIRLLRWLVTKDIHSLTPTS